MAESNRSHASMRTWPLRRREVAVLAFISLILAYGVFASSRPFSGIASVRDKKCVLSPTDSPAVRGLRLGMGVSELEDHYKGLKVPAQNDQGYTEIILFVNIDSYAEDVDNGRGIAMIKRPSFPEWIGVEKMILKFVDRKLADFTIHYTAGEPDWHNAEEFAFSLAGSLSLPRSWKKLENSMLLECEGVKIVATVERYSGGSGGILQIINLIALRMLRSRVEDSESRRKDDEERKRREFKP